MLSKLPTAAVFIIGDELLSGRTLDKNLNFLAKNLTERGILLKEGRFLPDTLDTLVAAIRWGKANHDLVITTGGIGPTHDDITIEAVSLAFDKPLIKNAQALEALEQSYGAKNLSPAHFKMAYLPEGARFVTNPSCWMGGFVMENVYVLAGVPHVMESMFQYIRPLLPTGPRWESSTLLWQGDETCLAESLGSIQKKFPTLLIGSYPGAIHSQRTVEIVIRGHDSQQHQMAVQEVEHLISGLKHPK